MSPSRTYYGSLLTGQVRDGSTGHGESLVDMDGYTLPMERARLGALLDQGVIEGLQVSAVVGQAGLGVAIGVAVDGKGQVIVLSADGAAIVDQTVPADQLRNVPTVPVGATGVTVPTAAVTGDQVIAVVYREALVTGQLGNNPVLVHTPWLVFRPAATWTDDVGVALASVSFDAVGAVTALSAQRRGLAAEAAGPALRTTTVSSGSSPVVGQRHGAQIQAVSSADGASVDLLLTPGGGNVGIGTTSPAMSLHVEGSGMHSGGALACFSFMDQTVSGFVENPTAGQRWMWYAENGSARLWSGNDQLTIGAAGEGGGLDVPRRMRVRQGGDASAGLWLRQNGSGDAAFIGMADDAHVGLWGSGIGWGLRMDVGTGHLDTAGSLEVHADLRVDGTASVGAATVTGALRINGGVSMPGASVISADGRMHISGSELLFLLNVGGVIVGKEWGGNGNLTVEGNLTAQGRQLQVGGVAPLPGWSGGGVIAFDVFAVAGLYVGGPDKPGCEFYANGTKHFVIDHPLDPEHRRLVHACIEGPEAGVYYRGEGSLVDGRAEIELPVYFEALTRAEGRTVMLTPVCGPDEPISTIAATRVVCGRFTVRATDHRNPAQRFCWEVKAARADVAPLRAEQDKTARQMAAAGR